MSLDGTAAYRDLTGLPPLVAGAVDAALELDFELCVRPEIGRLLAVLAAGLPSDALVGETGTGTGAGLAWMVSAAPAGTRFISYELDPERAASARQLFSDVDEVEVVCGDGRELFARGPFDLLVHDGAGGSGKAPGDRLVDPSTVLRPGGTMTVDDFTPATDWPPTFQGRPDHGRRALFEHPDLVSTEVRVAPDLAVVVSRFFTNAGEARSDG